MNKGYRIAASLCGLLASVATSAQTLDYSHLESLFDEPVTMSATGKPERVSDTPVTMDILTQDDIRRSGARDLPTLLKRLPGIDVYKGSPGTEELSMGGFVQLVNGRVMVLLNGRQIYLGSFGGVLWNSLPVELHEIRQIEVIRGAQSALYGFSAVDGVINVITFDPAEDPPVTEATGRLGNDARRDGAASITEKLAPGLGVRLTAAGDHAHDQGGLGSAFNPVLTRNPDRSTLSLALSAALADGTKAGLEASHSDFAERSVIAGTPQFVELRAQTDAVKADFTTDSAIGHVGGMASYTLTQVPEATSQSLGSFTLHDYSAAAQLYDLIKPGPRDTVRLALDGRYESMRLLNFTSGTLSGGLIAGSAMWEHQFQPDLSIVNAARYDHFQLGRSHSGLPGDIYRDADFDRGLQGVSLNSALIYKAGRDDTLRASFARGLALPSLLDLGQLSLFIPQAGGNYFYGNPDLKPSAVYEERVGWDHRLADLGVAVRTSLYHEQTLQIVGTAPLTASAPPSPYCVPADPFTARACVPVHYAADGGVSVTGLQVQIDHNSREGLTWGANYSWGMLHQQRTEQPGSGSAPLQDSLPRHKVNATLGYGWQDWAADLRLFYASATKSPGVVADPFPRMETLGIKDVIILSPHLSWSPLERLSFDFAAENLWPYKDNLLQRNSPTWFLGITAKY